jgi:hypothetical protein
MVDWTNGKPNPRYWVLKLLKDSFGPGDKLVETQVTSPYVYSMGVLTRDGKRRMLLVNKRDRDIELTVPGVAGARQEYVDQTTKFDPPGSAKLEGEKVTLRGLGVAVVTLP